MREDWAQLKQLWNDLDEDVRTLVFCIFQAVLTAFVSGTVFGIFLARVAWGGQG